MAKNFHKLYRSCFNYILKFSINQIIRVYEHGIINFELKTTRVYDKTKLTSYITILSVKAHKMFLSHITSLSASCTVSVIPFLRFNYVAIERRNITQGIVCENKNTQV